jgi:hypothetical protein
MRKLVLALLPWSLTLGAIALAISIAHTTVQPVVDCSSLSNTNAIYTCTRTDYGYPASYLLSDVSLKAPANASLPVVGVSSTARLYLPSVLIDWLFWALIAFGLLYLIQALPRRKPSKITKTARND